MAYLVIPLQCTRLRNASLRSLQSMISNDRQQMTSSQYGSRVHGVSFREKPRSHMSSNVLSLNREKESTRTSRIISRMTESLYNSKFQMMNYQFKNFGLHGTSSIATTTYCRRSINTIVFFLHFFCFTSVKVAIPNSLYPRVKIARRTTNEEKASNAVVLAISHKSTTITQQN